MIYKYNDFSLNANAYVRQLSLQLCNVVLAGMPGGGDEYVSNRLLESIRDFSYIFVREAFAEKLSLRSI